MKGRSGILRKVLAILLCLLMTFTLASCGETESGTGNGGSSSSPDGSNPPASPQGNTDPIYIGMINSITGDYADFGVGNKWSADRAVSEINAAGGIAGREVILVFDDDEGDATVATTLAQKMVDDEKILGLVGSFTTACSTVIAEVLRDKMCQISGSSSSTVYTDTSEWAFSIFGLLVTESRFMCRYVINTFLDNPTIGIMYSDTDFSHTALNAFQEQAQKDGVTIVDAISYGPSETDFSSMITKMQQSAPETLVLIGTEGGRNIINQVRSAGWDVQICSYSKSANLIEQLGDNADGLIVLSRFEFNQADDFEATFHKEYLDAMGYEPLLQSSASYDAVYMYKQVIEELVAEGAEVTRAAIRDKIAKIAYDGLTGHIEFDAGGMVDRGCFIFRVENGQFVQKSDYSYIDRGYD